MSFSRPSLSRYCAKGGALRARSDGCLPVSPGCFPATAGSIRVRASCIGSLAWQRGVPALPSASAFIRCGTALRTRLPAAVVAHPIDRGSTAHDHSTAVAIPHHRFCPRPPSHRHRPRAADRDRQRRLRPAKPQAPKTGSPGRSHPERPRPTPRWSLNRRPIRIRQIRSSSGGKFPIDRHQRGANSPAVSSLDAFRTPVSVHARTSVSGRRPKTLNARGRSFGRAAGTARLR